MKIWFKHKHWIIIVYICQLCHPPATDIYTTHQTPWGIYVYHTHTLVQLWCHNWVSWKMTVYQTPDTDAWRIKLQRQDPAQHSSFVLCLYMASLSGFVNLLSCALRFFYIVLRFFLNLNTGFGNGGKKTWTTDLQCTDLTAKTQHGCMQRLDMCWFLSSTLAIWCAFWLAQAALCGFIHNALEGLKRANKGKLDRRTSFLGLGSHKVHRHLLIWRQHYIYIYI